MAKKRKYTFMDGYMQARNGIRCVDRTLYNQEPEYKKGVDQAAKDYHRNVEDLLWDGDMSTLFESPYMKQMRGY